MDAADKVFTRGEMKRRVVVIDPHTSVRQMLAEMLDRQGSFDISGEAGSGLDGLRIYRKERPALIVFELVLPELSGVEMLRRLRSDNRMLRSFIYSGTPCPLQIRAALRARPHGFVRKADSLAVLRNGLQTVAAGGVYLRATVANYLDKAEIQTGGPPLSEGEREAIQMVAENQTAKEIAARLNLSTKTVQNHKMHAMDKLNLRGIAALTRFAVREGIVEP
jgi:DNA-binding NarL/FixJ family response regulator